MYGKLAGMTGTADTEAYEFQEIYGLETVVMPPNKPSQRKDRQDQVYKTGEEKYNGDAERHPATATSAASRCWSAPPRSRTPNCCPAS